MRIAPVLASAEDQAAYADFCGRMARQFAESKRFEDAERVVKASLLRTSAVDLTKPPAVMFTRLLDDGTAPDEFRAWG